MHIWKTYVNGDEDVDALVLLPCIRPVIPLLTGVVTDNQSALGQLLEEAFRGRAVDVEEERVRNGQEREEGDDRPHLGECERRTPTEIPLVQYNRELKDKPMNQDCQTEMDCLISCAPERCSLVRGRDGELVVAMGLP